MYLYYAYIKMYEEYLSPKQFYEHMLENSKYQEVDMPSESIPEEKIPEVALYRVHRNFKYEFKTTFNYKELPTIISNFFDKQLPYTYKSVSSKAIEYIKEIHSNETIDAWIASGADFETSETIMDEYKQLISPWAKSAKIWTNFVSRIKLLTINNTL